MHWVYYFAEFEIELTNERYVDGTRLRGEVPFSLVSAFLYNML
jgi:hypothetical protein